MWYKGILIILAMATYVAAIPLADTPATGNEPPLPKSLYEMQRKNEVQILASMEGGVAADSATLGNPNKPNVGKALLLSAILPGTGQLYLGETVKGYIFLGVEAAAWVFAINYTVQGNNADRDFKHYVDANWHEDWYRSTEYSFAIMDTLPTRQSGTAFTGQYSQWQGLSWDEKSQYLPSNFTHELPSSHNQQYYEMVGKYMTQFGYGWGDTHPNGAPNYDSTNGIWNGTSPEASHYEDMRYTSNKLLKMGNNFMMLATLNHVLSVTDMIITLHSMHDKQVSTTLRIEPRTINNEVVNMSTFRVTF